MKSTLTARRALFYVRRNVLVSISAVILLGLILLSLLAPWIAPHPEDLKGVVHPEIAFSAPSGAHWFGTDELGRDLYSMVLYGGRVSLTASFIIIAIAVSVGMLVGLVAGYFGGWVDEVIMRFTDIVLSFPSLLLAVSISALLGPSLTNTVIAIALSWWPWYTRLIRSQVTALKHAGFVESATLAGNKPWTIMRKHILPNSLTPIIVQASIDLGSVILTLAGLSFLGMGAQAPSAEWGLLVSQGKTYVMSNWWYVTFPGIPILLSAIALNLIGDGVRDLLDPRQKGVTR